jgi:3-oxoacyl-[acyl-carrier-protein] synthase-3
MPTIPTHAIGGVITGWGTALPSKVVTNDDLSKTMDTSDEWIRERTGIHRRHIGGSTAELSVESGRIAMEMAGVSADQIVHHDP